VDFSIEPAMTSTPPTEVITDALTKMLRAAMTAQRFGEPEPNYVGSIACLEKKVSKNV
jgi:hypothetical protein